MSTPKRESILAALATRLSAVRNPYPSDYNDSPLTTLLEGEESVTDREYSDVLITMPVTVEKIDRYDEGSDRETVANDLLAAVIAAALGTDPTVGGLCDDVRYTGGSTLFSSTGSELIAAVARFDIIYRHAGGSPY